MRTALRNGPALLVGLLLVLAACGGAGRTSQVPSGTLTITSHEDGDSVGTASIQVRGTAPAGAAIVHDIALARDKRTSAEEDGTWVMTVDLDEGDNDLTFRIGDDDSTSKTIRVIYDPAVAAAPSVRASEDADETAEPTSRATTAPTAQPTPRPTPAPTPIPTATVFTFGGGDKIVGTDVPPGTYRTRSPAGFCYWERLSGFSGSFDELISNGTGGGYFTVTIAASDVGFSSQGCGTWSADLSAVTAGPNGPITEDGIYIVGTDMAPGTWRSAGGGSLCYAARLSGFSGDFDHLITNELSSDGGLIMTVAASDKGFETTGCGTWTKVG